MVVRRAHLDEGSTLLRASLYPVTSIGLVGENLGLLAAVAEVLVPDPFVMGADWNAAPEDLATLSWVDELAGIIAQPGAPTCRGSECDLFACS